MARIRIKNGPHKGAEFNLTDNTLVIGRDELPDGIQILDQGVSRRHAKICKVGEMFFIRDLGSRNGTYVNEERVTEELLRVGDEVKIGSTLMVFEEKRSETAKDSGRIGSPKGLDSLAATTVIRLGDPSEDDLTLDPEQETQESRDLQVLYKVAKTLVSEHDVDGLTEKVVKVTAEAIGADHGYAFVRHHERGEISLAGSFEKQGKQAPVVSKNIIRRVLKLGRAVLTSDASLDDRFREHGSVVMKQIRSVICAPLVTTDQLAGALYFSNSKLAQAFSSEDLELVTAIGIQAGMAVQGLTSQVAQERSFLELVGALVTAVEMRNPKSRGKSQFVTSVASGIATAMGLTTARNRRLQLAAMLHNVGGLFFEREDDVLDADSAQTKTIRLGSDFVKRLRGMNFLQAAIKHQNERFDGEGTPDGLVGEDIPLEARVIAVAVGYQEAYEELEDAGESPDADEIFNRLNDDEGRYDPNILDFAEQAEANGWFTDPPERLGDA